MYFQLNFCRNTPQCEYDFSRTRDKNKRAHDDECDYFNISLIFLRYILHCMARVVCVRAVRELMQYTTFGVLQQACTRSSSPCDKFKKYKIEISTKYCCICYCGEKSKKTKIANLTCQRRFSKIVTEGKIFGAKQNTNRAHRCRSYWRN